MEDSNPIAVQTDSAQNTAVKGTENDVPNENVQNEKTLTNDGLPQPEEEAVEGLENANGAKKKKKKKKKKKQAKKLQAREMEEFNAWCQQVLENTKEQVEGVDEKTLHQVPPEFENYEDYFTGSLRPHYVTKQMTVPSHIVKPDYGDTGIPQSEIDNKRNSAVHCYSEEELVQFREVCKLSREVMEAGRKFLRAGVTADEIDRIIYQACIDRECYPSPLNYNNFRKSVCVSVNEVICHGIPDCRVIQEGDIVNLDVTVYKYGFHSDLNETFFIGEVDEVSKNLVRTAYETLAEATKMIRPRTMYRDLGPVISKVASANNCSVVRSYCGHGIGRLFHTTPNVPHYAKNKGIGIMKAGHVFTIEPMINASPNWRDNLWPDNWTAVTRDGSRSAQFEHTFVVTEDGVEIMTARPGASKSELVWDEAYVQRPGLTTQ